MAKIGIIRCEKSLDHCSLSCCLRCIGNGAAAVIETPSLAGIVACHCPGDNVVKLAMQLKAKGAEVIYLCTCAFTKVSKEGWSREEVFCEHIDRIVQDITQQAGIPCKKVIAPLPDIVTPNFGRVHSDNSERSYAPGDEL